MDFERTIKLIGDDIYFDNVCVAKIEKGLPATVTTKDMYRNLKVYNHDFTSNIKLEEVFTKLNQFIKDKNEEIVSIIIEKWGGFVKMVDEEKFEVKMTLVAGQIKCTVFSDKMSIIEVTSCLIDCHRALAVQMASIITEYFGEGINDR